MRVESKNDVSQRFHRLRQRGKSRSAEIIAHSICVRKQ